MLTYASQLKSMTGGQGSFTMEFKSYEPVPPNVQQQIVEKYKKSARASRRSELRLSPQRRQPRSSDLACCRLLTLSNCRFVVSEAHQ